MADQEVANERYATVADPVVSCRKSAPFTIEQRTWLNGLLAGVYGLEGGVTPLSSADVAKLLPGFIEPVQLRPPKSMMVRLGMIRRCRCPTA